MKYIFHKFVFSKIRVTIAWGIWIFIFSERKNKEFTCNAGKDLAV